MIQKTLAILLSRKLSGEATQEELQQFEQWIKDHPEDQLFVEIMHSYWESSALEQLVDRAPDEHFLRIVQKAERDEHPAVEPDSVKPMPGIFRIKRWWVAAAILGLLFLGARWLWVSNTQPGQEPEISEVFAARGVKSHLFLPDGSSVWLNSDSRIYFDKRFEGAIREVTLDGEAFFKVVRNTKRPFIVHTSAIDIKVLGTSFNVKAYENDKTIETTLINGSVEVLNKKDPGEPKILLKPKEKLIYIKERLKEPTPPSGPIPTEKDKRAAVLLVKPLPPGIADSAFAETSWVHNRLIFDGDDFVDLAAKMERWFNVQIVFKNQAVANYRLRGAFEKETIEEALEGLQLIVPFKYKISERMVEIY